MFGRQKHGTGPLKAVDETSQLYHILARANQIASNTELDELIRQMLDLIILICGANAGTLYLLEKDRDALLFAVTRGNAEGEKLVGQRINATTGIVGHTIKQAKTIVVPNLNQHPLWYRPLGEQQKNSLKNMISVPLLLRGTPIGVVQVFNFTQQPVQMVELLGNRMASEIEKAMLLRASENRSERLSALVSIINEISSTLDRDQILNLIIEKARVLLNAEASSLFLLDQKTGELILHIAQDVHATQLPPVRIPAGQGIIGHVVQTGETVVVNDVAKDPRHYGFVDDVSGIKTKNVIAVPLKSPRVVLGQDRGITASHIIGGLETINKLDGYFSDQDTQLMQTLAQQAATVLHIARLYADANDLFLDTIKALAAAIDAKDPYTEGHSQRVSEFSIEIAREMGLPQDVVHHIRVGSLLHDFGKIGIPDAILAKPGRLTPEEYREMKKHPTIGANIMRNVRMLEDEIAAIEHHHERVDGLGYPNGLKGDDFSLSGRIVAVADVFDALTSDRPYRKGISVEETLDILHRDSGTHLDPACVQALTQAYLKGKIKTQPERDKLKIF